MCSPPICADLYQNVPGLSASQLRVQLTRDTAHENKRDESGFIGLRWTLSDEDWRKGVGVEPTKSRLATLSGFEGQPPHRERFPSIVDINQNVCAVTHR